MLSRIKEADNLDFALVPVEQNKKTNHIEEESRTKREKLWAYLSDHLKDNKQLRILRICVTLDLDNSDNSANQEEETGRVVIPLREHLRKKCFRLINSKHFNSTILALIALNCVSMSINDPLCEPKQTPHGKLATFPWEANVLQNRPMRHRSTSSTSVHRLHLPQCVRRGLERTERAGSLGATRRRRTWRSHVARPTASHMHGVSPLVHVLSAPPAAPRAEQPIVPSKDNCPPSPSMRCFVAGCRPTNRRGVLARWRAAVSDEARRALGP